MNTNNEQSFELPGLPFPAALVFSSLACQSPAVVFVKVFQGRRQQRLCLHWLRVQPKCSSDCVSVLNSA